MAGGIDWFRWHHGSVTDPKFQLVARKAGVRLPDVLAVWAFVLEKASASDERGTFGSLDCEAIDCLFGLEDGQTALILEQMQARDLVHDGEVVAWDKRQPKREREGDSSAERTRAYRTRQKEGAKGDANQSRVTPCDATERHETPRGEESRVEKSNTSNNQQACVRAENDPFPMTPDWRPGETFSSIAKPAGLIPPTGADWDAALAEFVSYWLSKPGEERTHAEWEHALVKSLKHSKGAARGGRSPPGQQPSRKETQLYTAALMTGTAGTQGQQPATTEIIDADPSPSAPRLVG